MGTKLPQTEADDGSILTAAAIEAIATFAIDRARRRGITTDDDPTTSRRSPKKMDRMAGPGPPRRRLAAPAKRGARAK